MRTLELLKRLPADQSQHIVVTTSGRKGSLAAEYERAGATVVPMAINQLRFIGDFYALLRREQPHAVHSNIHFMSGPILLIALVARVPNRVSHFRSDGDPIREGRGVRRLRNSVLKFLIGVCATRVLGVSPSAIESAWSPNWRTDPKCGLLANGVDIARFQELLMAEDLVPLELPSGQSRYIVHIGRADTPTKNREKAISVFGDLAAGEDVALLFVGRDGTTARDAAENLIRWQGQAAAAGVSGHVQFLGERNDIDRLLLGASAMLFTSTLEGLPGVLLEGLAAGLPIVSSDVAGAEFIASTVEGLTILKPSDSDALWAASVKSAMERPLTRDERIARSNKLRNSIFDLNVSSRNYLLAWGIVH